ncbi:MAG: hypothetical protein U1E89_09190 [Burkholderiaceae bacterium]
MSPLPRALFALLIVSLHATAPAQDTLGPGGLRAGLRSDARATSGTAAPTLLADNVSIGSIDRYRLVSTVARPALGGSARGPALGDVPPSVRDRELLRLRQGADAARTLTRISLNARE